MELHLDGWNRTYLDGTGFTLSHLIRQLSRGMVVGIGVWLDGIPLGRMEWAFHCHTWSDAIVKMFAYGGWNWRLVGWNCAWLGGIGSMLSHLIGCSCSNVGAHGRMELAFGWMKLAPWFQIYFFARSVQDRCLHYA
jgi:hypothetical protein